MTDIVGKVELKIHPMMMLQMVGTRGTSGIYIPISCEDAEKMAMRIMDFIQKDLSHLVILDNDEVNIVLDALSTTEPMLKIGGSTYGSGYQCPVDRSFLKEWMLLLQEVSEDSVFISTAVHNMRGEQ